MQEAFSVLYKLSPDLYTEGSPVVIAAGQLLKDNNTGTILGQLKLKNIGNKPVSAVTVCFVPLDPAGRPAGGPFEFRYMDLDCARDGFCASRKAVPFPDPAARSFSVSVKEVIFSDGSVFALPENAVWESLPAPVKRESFTNKYAEMGFISCFPESAAYKTEKVLDLWYCGCGAINRAEEKACHLCQKEYKSFFDPESEFKQAGKYVQAEEYLSGSDPDKLKKAVSRFKKLGNYLDAPKRAEEAEAKLETALTKKKIEKIIVAILFVLAVFAALVFLVFKNLFAYNAASSLLINGNYEVAKVAFTALGTYKDSTDMAKECDYRRAKALLSSGKYAEAYTAFCALKGYKDVDTLLASDENLKAVAAAAALDAAWQPGKYVTFGRYEQDNNKSNGAEAIEWRVLARNGSKALILSKYGLEAKPYNEKCVNITWEKCTLRAWLNGEFLNTAFDGTEQARIQLTAVDNSWAQGYSKWVTYGGNDTQDKVFLLSYAEANKYLGVTYDNSNNTDSRVSPTAYAEANGAYTSSDNKTAEGKYAGWWWLRSPGSHQFFASGVYSGGSLDYDRVNYGGGVVRPALWVEIS